MKSNSTWFASLKLFLISAGIVSLAVGVRFVAPVIIHGVVHEIPALWSILLSWLKPPYLYVIINGIIIIIVAASRFHHRESEPSVETHENLISVKTPPSLEFASIPTPTDISTVMEEPPVAVQSALVYESEDGAVEMKPVVVNDSEIMENDDDVSEAEDEDEDIVSNSPYSTPPEGTSSPPFLLPIREKPLASSRFGNHRKNLKSSPEGTKVLRVARPKRQETLESTWKMIMEGRHVPLTRQWKKQDIWKDREHDMTGSHSNHVNKSETKNHVNYDSPKAPLRSCPSLKVRKELSVGHEELNRRVEAFIKKFNEEMRIQRQESLQRYMEMINSGV